MESTPTESVPQAAAPLSYASTLLQPLGSRVLSSKAMLGDFTLEDDDYEISEGKRGPNISFSQKVEEKLNLDWNCAAIVKLMGNPKSDNAFEFMHRGLTRKWKLKGPWQLIDIPNGFFVVKFQLFEDLDYVLCGGPWIISGQTLVVQKWRPDFNPMVEKINRMAIWVRILGLPLKYFKDFTMRKIGNLIGPVLKIDKVTLAQARGKFCRICVEVNPNEPLKPFVEVDFQAYGVVYEGISTICFNCGVYGHVKGQWPYNTEHEIVQDTTVDDTVQPPIASNPTIEEPVSAPATHEKAMEEDKAETKPNNKATQGPSPTQSMDMGPWMVMNYRNRKPMSNNSSTTKQKANQGSRFAPLQDNVTEDTENQRKVSSTSEKTTEQKVVKTWKPIQKNQVSSSKNDNATVIAGSAAAKNHPKAAPLKDVSNLPSTSKPLSVTSKATKGTINRKLMISIESTKSPITEFPILNAFKNISTDTHISKSIDGEFGNSPPEEVIVACEVDKSISDSSIPPTNANHICENDKKVNIAPVLSSPDGEDMIVA
ncbi:uncharacterized protein LOC133724601 [Rosa rugosa]|uniref:uncharacterized protein LOC133724601 n=1 Tax=Rosa rugosa TaxID=74645 RepID=UPI002B40D4D5|nr:uncharacterized protein LOC133724601 [Rosa rugosa]